MSTRLLRSARLLTRVSTRTKPLGVRTLTTATATKSNSFGTAAIAFTALAGGIAGFGLSQYNSSAAKDVVTTGTEGKYGSPEDVKRAIRALREAFPEDAVFTDKDVLHTYGHSDNSYHPGANHDVVVRVYSTEDVVNVVKIANKYRIPITAYSGGTSLEGHFGGHEKPPGGICVDLSGMDKILHINEADSDLICQSGAKWEDINETLKEKGIPLFFPLDPGPGATIGGMVGTGCSGTNAVRYGTAKGEWFLNLTVVLPSGEVIKTRRRARKSSAGFDTTKLFVGAEGTLGIVTEATLRLAPKLPTSVAIAQFPDVYAACSAVSEVLRSPIGQNIQCVELVDDHMMDAINKQSVSSKKYAVKDSLFFKIQGTPESIAHSAKIIKSIVEKHQSHKFEFAKTDAEANELWAQRKYALFSTISLIPGSRVWTTDVCVPISRLPELVYETKDDMAKHDIPATIVGHVGDGNFHALMIIRNDNELPNVREAVHRLVHRAIAMDGTCTGEHGVGIGKKEYLVDELGEGTVELMRVVKRAIDPHGLMNPGKLYPEPSGGSSEKQSKH